MSAKSKKTRDRQIDYRRFYKQLFAPLEDEFGVLDRNTLFALMGFDGGGPLSFCTFNYEKPGKPKTFVSCELAVRPEQQPAKFGRFELLCTCDDERSVRKILSEIGRSTLDERFDYGHTTDLGYLVQPHDPIQGVLFKKACSARINGNKFGVLRCVGITRPEMTFKRAHGAGDLVKLLRKAGIYPRTILDRESVVDPV